jgi:cytochrome c-type biogenesis protein
LLFALSSALYLGILTSVSPCPLATNIAAISFIARGINSPRRVALTGLLYTLGRTVAYISLAAILVAGILAVPSLAHFLERYMNRLLGPILIVAGMFLLGLMGSSLSGPGLSGQLQRRIGESGATGAALLGMIFALSFCPVSAAIFFGSLLPIAVSRQSSFLIPAAYGIGTALPVLAFAILIAAGTRRIGAAFHRLSSVELWSRRITGAVFIVIGILYSFTYIFEIPVLG